MLLRNESRVKHSIEIKLIFDDNKMRCLEIHESDEVQVSYRKNGCLRHGVGVIRRIKPYVYTKRFPFCKRESAVIVLDMSEDLVSCVDQIDLYDIIDIRKVEPVIPDGTIDPDFNINGGCGCCCKAKEDTESDTETEVGSAITEEGVVIND